MNIDFARVGGYLCLLTLLHFAVDWICQSHDEAMRKTREWRVRARHCLVYTAPFAVVLLRTSWSLPWSLSMTVGIFLSHFVEDTYLPVLWWAKYVRCPPQMRRRLVESADGQWSILDYDGSGGCFALPSWTDAESAFILRLKAGEARKSVQKDLDLDGFISFVSEPLGKSLLIAVDQIVHIAFLLPAAYMLAAQP